MSSRKSFQSTQRSSDGLLEELTSDGRGTGLESLGSQEDEHRELPFDPGSLKVETRSMSVHQILHLISQAELILTPEYQRRYGLWDNHRQSRLIESLLLRLPIPSLYLSENDNGSYSVVDGVQRLSTIVRFVSPDDLGAGKKTEEMRPFRLADLEYMSAYENCAFEDLPLRMQRRILDTPLLMYIIRRGTPEIVKFNVFDRINTGGLPLSGQELRSALIGGQAREILAELANSDTFQEATNRSVSPERLGDQELILRYFAFERLWPWDRFGRTAGASFLNDAMHAINAWSPAETHNRKICFLEAMELSLELFAEHAFRKVVSNSPRLLPINRALFEVESVLCACIPVRRRAGLRHHHERVMRELSVLLETNVDFWRSVSQATGSAKAVSTRFGAMHQLLRSVDLA